MQSLLYSATFYGGFVTTLPTGYIADRFGPKYLLQVATADYTVVTLLSPFLAEYSFNAFLAARITMGLGEGLMMPTMSSMASRWFPSSERSTMVALYTSGTQLAGAFSTPVASTLCQLNSLGGWHSIFYVFG
ncbi:hypothetical protein AB6A40_005098 [Gnathostoma spinigerum]|uniref:Major facilitator superfamily (MFS) profile domain-containing protein n=1 Tax=Gnathostoma spinigerum TaxID=75299 RepID=A0ABD6EEG0_9BILA